MMTHLSPHAAAHHFCFFKDASLPVFLVVDRARLRLGFSAEPSL